MLPYIQSLSFILIESIHINKISRLLSLHILRLIYLHFFYIGILIFPHKERILYEFKKILLLLKFKNLSTLRCRGNSVFFW